MLDCAGIPQTIEQRKVHVRPGLRLLWRQRLGFRRPAVKPARSAARCRAAARPRLARCLRNPRNKQEPSRAKNASIKFAKGPAATINARCHNAFRLKRKFQQIIRHKRVPFIQHFDVAAQGDHRDAVLGARERFIAHRSRAPAVAVTVIRIWALCLVGGIKPCQSQH